MNPSKSDSDAEQPPKFRTFDEAESFFKPLNWILSAKNKHTLGDIHNPVDRLMRHYESISLTPRESAILERGEYWVAIFFNGDSYLPAPIIPEWVGKHEEDEWLAEYHISYQEVGDCGWPDDLHKFLYSTRHIYRQFARYRRIVYRDSSGKLHSCEGDPNNNLMLEKFQSWRDRDRSFEPEISLINGFTEDQSRMASQIHEYLNSAIDTLEDSSGDLTEKEEKALAHAFMAGKMAKTLSSFGNREITKEAYPMVDKKGLKAEWTKRASEILVENPNRKPREVALQLQEESIFDFDAWDEGKISKLSDSARKEGETMTFQSFRSAFSRLRRKISKKN